MGYLAPAISQIYKRLSLTSLVAAICILGVVLIIVALATSRSLFNVGAEIDTLHTFIPEARRLASLDPLQVKFHLPGYSLALGMVFAVVGDWLRAGLVVSAAAAAIALIASYFAFRRLWGFAGGIGAIVGLATSPVFLSYGAQATSDVPFLALFASSLMLAARALDTKRPVDWALTGAMVAAAVLARTNGVALLLMLFVPMLASLPGSRRAQLLASAWAGFAAVTGLWVLYSTVTGSPLLPRENHVNLALTYYSEGSRSSNDEMQAVAGLFSSATELLLADPARVLRIYWQDLRALPIAITTQLAWLPLLLTAVLGSWIWWRDRRHPAALMLAAVTIASLLLLNLHAFNARFYLFLLPVFGATAGAFVYWALGRLSSQTMLVRTLTGLVALAVLFGVVRSGMDAHAQVVWLENSAEFDESIAAVKQFTAPDAAIIARKHTVPRYAVRRRIHFPRVDSAVELCKSIQALPGDHPIYLYIGREERNARQALSLDLLTGDLPVWLEPVVSRGGSAPWLLFRVRTRLECR